MDEAQLKAYLQQLQEKVTEHGHMVINVIGAFSYTVGLTPTLGYELVTIGLPQNVGHNLLNDLAKRLASGPIADGEDIAELANFPLRLRTVPLLDPATGRSRREIVSMAFNLGHSAETCRQLLWPDPQGRFPGDPGYAMKCTQNVDDVIEPAKGN